MTRNQFTAALRKFRTHVSGLLLLAVMFPVATASALPPSATRLEGDQFAEPDAALGHFSALEESEMDAMRGGFFVRGMNIRFGVNSRYSGVTARGENFHYETSHLLNASGDFDLISENKSIDPGLIENAPVNTVGGSGGVSLSDINGLNEIFAGLSDATGGLIIGDGSDKVTAFLTKLASDTIFGAVISTDNDQILNSQIEVDITIKNFTEYSDTARNSVFAGSLGRSVRSMTAPR